MSVSKSRLAYDDCFIVMDKALELNGVRVEFAERGKATYFRMRLNSARDIDRQENRVTYDTAHLMHGRSVYDTLIFRVKEDTEGSFWVYLEMNDTRNLVIEPLGESEQAT